MVLNLFTFIILGASDFTKYKYKKQSEMPNKEDLDQELDEFMSQNNNRVSNSPKTTGIFGSSTSIRDPRLKLREITENVCNFLTYCLMLL